jgi:Holliday junction resolvase RusA-like endonuclease
MEMWNWLMKCYKQGSLTKKDLDNVMKHYNSAITLWQCWSRDSDDFIDWIRSEVGPFIKYLEEKEADDK